MHVKILKYMTGRPPEVFASDRSPSLIAATQKRMPLTLKIYCLHHLDGNVQQNLRPVLDPLWDPFKIDFWGVYNATSPTAFDAGWTALTKKYPSAKAYLVRELYPCRENWAVAWLGFKFTCALGGPKVTATQLFHALNERTQAQTAKEQELVRQSSHRQHDTNLERLFVEPLALLRKHACPYALQTCHREMGLSVYYGVDVIQLPSRVRNWCMRDDFTNDNRFIAADWLMELVHKQALQIKRILRVSHMSTKTTHIMVQFTDGAYFCDCCMGSNLGLPCLHFFAALTRVQGMGFYITHIRTR
ncbi:hypothetical protein M422DRAFT_61956 [Sphaerobolus stellatus SS14]|uniref:SWIM-type domain-containing protein n=1 Tax=Sphaerobolus stellatus (strain SS14) TaxID=990650 RepID=A0A0C9U1T4_SPHS4|nr:hypothetical protein M422DRAFT_61956 [Sphaerobolus stellatus SS14]